MQALRLYCLLSYQENERNEYSCDYWIDRFSCSIIISYSHFQELFRCSPLGKATGTTASNQIISTGISNAPKLNHWLAAVIRFTRSGDAPSTPFQIADVDSGVIRWVNADLLAHILQSTLF